MNAVSFPQFHDDEECPPTERAPALGLAKLIARTRPEAAEDTLSVAPSLDLIALATGADDKAVATMRNLYARGEMDQALAIAALIPCSAVVDDADIEEIDNAFLHLERA